MGKDENATEQKNKDDSNKVAVNSALFIGSIILLITIIFLLSIHIGSPNDHDLDSYTKSDLGTLGDLLGGTLNPILSFATICLLVWSIQIQLKELSDTREELRTTNAHHSQNIAEQKHHFRTEQILRNLDVLENEVLKLFNSVVAHPGTWVFDGSFQSDCLTVAAVSERPELWKKLNSLTTAKLEKALASFLTIGLASKSIYHQFLISNVPSEYYSYRLANIVYETVTTISRLKENILKSSLPNNVDIILVELQELHDELFEVFADSPNSLAQTQTKPD